MDNPNKFNEIDIGNFPPIPTGWRKVRPDEFVKEGDKWSYLGGRKWELTLLQDEVPLPYNIYITKRP